MPPHVTRLFSQSDLDRIAQAVKEAETKTSGEIVPYVVDHSDTYEDAEWRGAFLFALVAFTVLTVVRQYTRMWIPLDLAEVAAISLGAAMAGILLAKFVPLFKRLFAGNALMHRRVTQRAAEAFVSEEVFNTRDRSGILSFMSVVERKVLRLGESGINAKVQQDEWHEIVQRIVRGIRAGKATEGLVEAIGQCGLLLQRHGVAIRPDDKDELPDSLRMKDE